MTLVAFTIELDNEFERRMPHRTSRQRSSAGAREGPWLVSAVMWSTCMRFVGDEGVRVKELESLARTPTNLNGMERWGYIVVAPDPADARPKPPRSDWLIRATPKGREAQDVWRPLFGVIEERWRERFGGDEIDQLRSSLVAVVSRIDLDLPDCLPILRFGLLSKGPYRQRRAPVDQKAAEASQLPLSALLSKVLLAFATEHERESDQSFAIGANLLRVLDEKGVPVRDLPLETGVAKEAISMALGALEKRGFADVETEQAGSRTKIVRLTARGQRAQSQYRQMLGVIEKRWQDNFGQNAISALREPLERLVGDPDARQSPLFRGLEPYPDGWRAAVRKPDTLPHFPMVLHRGGFPDGS